MRRLDVLSVGSAPPGMVKALTTSLGLSGEAVASVLYRAPATLVSGLGEDVARELERLLAQSGLRVANRPDDAPSPPPPPCLDLAIHVTDPAVLTTLVERLSAFLGAPPNEVLAMLYAPPGLVLGEVSPATVEALEARLEGLPVEVVTSERGAARYDLFCDPAEATLRATLRRELCALGLTPVDDDGALLATGLDHRSGEPLWRRYGARAAVRLLDRAFARCDLWLRACEEGARADALARLSGMPAEVAELVLEQPPLVIEQGVRLDRLPERLRAYRDAGFVIEGQLVTFQRYALRLHRCRSPEALVRALGAVGLVPEMPAHGLPARVMDDLTDLQARVADAVVASLGDHGEIEEA